MKVNVGLTIKFVIIKELWFFFDQLSKKPDQWNKKPAKEPASLKLFLSG